MAEVKVEGVRELTRSLSRVDRELVNELKTIHREIAEPIAASAQSKAPSRSGRLAGSIRAQAGQRYGRVAAGGARVPYAGPIHFGWPARNIEPHTFLQDALDQNIEETVDRYHELLDQFINRVWETI